MLALNVRKLLSSETQIRASADVKCVFVFQVTNFIIFIAKVTTTISISAITFFILHREDIRSGLELKEPKYIAAPVAVSQISN